MLVINLFDKVFAHDLFATAGATSQYIIWDREHRDPKLPTFFSHGEMLRPDRLNVPKELRFGLLVESQAIEPQLYREVESVIADYRLVFTHSSSLLERFTNTRWIPGSSTWVGGRMVGGEHALFPKSQVCSILSSNKLSAPLHRKRYIAAQRLRFFHPEIKSFIQKLGSSSRVSVLDTLADFRYSICMENFIDDEYFTEKILNCFATGTVPIYFGARNITRFFDPGGVITFSSYRDLVRNVLPSLNEVDYESRKMAIKQNLKLVDEYRSLEDFIFTHYLRKLN